MKRELRGFVVEGRATQRWKAFCTNFPNRIKIWEKNWFFAFWSLLQYMPQREKYQMYHWKSEIYLIFLAGACNAVSSRKQKNQFFSKTFILFGKFAQEAFQRWVARPSTTETRSSRFIWDSLNFSHFRPNASECMDGRQIEFLRKLCEEPQQRVLVVRSWKGAQNLRNDLHFLFRTK